MGQGEKGGTEKRGKGEERREGERGEAETVIKPFKKKEGEKERESGFTTLVIYKATQ